jgi:D-3-phosphoglycerate dehydrogenase
MKKILVSDPVDKQCVSMLSEAGFDVHFRSGILPDELKKIIPGYNGLVVRSETQVNSGLIKHMENMEVIGRAGTGVDNIDVDAATRKGIIVMNTPGGNTISTAEHTIALMLGMSRNIAQANISLRQGKWDRKSFKGSELNNKTLGIIGLGKIGKEVALRAKAFGMKVIGFDPLLSEEVSLKAGIKPVALNELFETSDIITLHVPFNEQTKNIISEHSLAKCKKGVKIINCARGGLVDEAALISALDSGQVSAAAFDVYEQEPPDFKSKLFTHPKVLCTPHLGASTEEAQVKVAIQIAEQIIALFNNNQISGAVNTSPGNEISENLKPYIKLAKALGSLQSQLLEGNLKKINLSLSGEMLQRNSEMIIAYVLQGFLSERLTDPVNFISAPFIARELGITINQTQSSVNENYNNLLTIECEGEKLKKTIAGTVFGLNEIRIVRYDNFSLEINPFGNMLLYYNIDRPGMLAKVGSVLADKQINIAGLSLGRTVIGGEALTVVNVDSPVDEKVINQISSIDGIKDIRAVRINF